MRAKAGLRRRLLSARAALSAAEVEQKSTAIATCVGAMPAFRKSRTIMVYMSLPQEVQTTRIIQAARQQRKRIAVPVIKGPLLMAVELPQESFRLRRGTYGILEPCPTAPVLRPDEIQYVAVPGVAFDRRGGRIGFGKGYYDRFLAQLPPTTYACGLAFDMQIVPYVPRLSHDICLHGIVTEQGLITCKEATARQSGTRWAAAVDKGERH